MKYIVMYEFVRTDVGRVEVQCYEYETCEEAIEEIRHAKFAQSINVPIRNIRLFEAKEIDIVDVPAMTREATE